MSWDTGVTMGHIASVTAVGDKAIAIEYDADGKQITYTVANVYVNAAAETDASAEVRLDNSETAKSGSGNYVIIEFNESIASQIATVWQRMTLRMNTVFANAMPWAYTVQ